MHAAFQGTTARVHFLLSCGASVTATDCALVLAHCPKGFGRRGTLASWSFGAGQRTALHWAAEAGSAPCIAALVAAGADVHAMDGPEQPNNTRVASRSAPIHIAAYWGHEDAVRALLAHGADANDGAAGAAGPASLRRQQQHPSSTPLLAAIQGGHEGVVSLLLAAGADPSAPARCSQAEAPLFAAVRRGCSGIVRLLLAAAARPTAQLQACTLCSQEHTPQYLADCMLKRPNLERHLGRRDAPTALHVAACCCRGDIVRLLLAAGAEVNARDAQGATPLHAAAAAAWRTQPVDSSWRSELGKEEEGEREEEGRQSSSQLQPFEDVLRALLDGGADVHAADRRGATPLGVLCTRPDTYFSWHDVTEEQCQMFAAATNLLLAAGAAGVTDSSLAEAEAEAFWGELEKKREKEEEEEEEKEEERMERGARGEQRYSPLFLACTQGPRCVAHALLSTPGTAVSPSLLRQCLIGRASSRCVLGTSVSCRRCHLGVLVPLLAGAGGDVSSVRQGRPLLLDVLHQDTGQCRQDAVEALLRCGADASAAALPSGETALMAAAASLDADLVQVLLQQGADVRAVASNGATALHAACEHLPLNTHGFWHRPAAPVVQQLLAAGVPPGAADWQGVLPVQRLDSAVAAVLQEGAVDRCGLRVSEVIKAMLADADNARQLLAAAVGAQPAAPAAGLPGGGRETRN